MVNPLYILLPCAVLIVAAYHGSDLPPGPYCGITNECCRNREDDCSYPILDTLCYCDEHCNRTHDDCCPDYEEVCLGIQPPQKKAEPDPVYPPENTEICTLGTTRMEECNLCVCDQTFRRNDWVCEQEECMMNDKVVALVNQGEPWTATKYANFTTKKLKDGLIYKLGTMPIDRLTQRMHAVRYDKQIQYPIYFDSRTRWPGFISPVQDQGWCGADWAVTIAGVASDRFAIQSRGAENIGLSPQTMLSCNIRGQQGCEGGHIDNAWNFVGSHGLVDEVCFPYKAMKTPCPYQRRGNLYDDHCKPLLPKRTSRYKVGPPLRLKAEEDIMYEIMDSGPVHAIMTVYQDFFHYRSGVYRHTPYGNEVLEGHHSVRIIGWGEERGVKYWALFFAAAGRTLHALKYVNLKYVYVRQIRTFQALWKLSHWIVANSWGPEWGEDGYFRIKRGVNECRIESFVLTVLAEVTEA